MNLAFSDIEPAAEGRQGNTIGRQISIPLMSILSLQTNHFPVLCVPNCRAAECYVPPGTTSGDQEAAFDMLAAKFIVWRPVIAMVRQVVDRVLSNLQSNCCKFKSSFRKKKSLF